MSVALIGELGRMPILAGIIGRAGRADLGLGCVVHAMAIQVIPDHLAHDLRGCQILRGTEILEGFFLNRID